MCPGCGISIHALCGHLNKDASIQYKTTCFLCYEKYDMAPRDPAEAQEISATEEEVPPITMTANNGKKVSRQEGKQRSIIAGR